ncbi:HET-domain-containing protein [Mycena sanguinolenta]|uniref:HET-domain-containing protein n=1 Tax=Mycena sanguinolenta TaxID=230812 RepID=A0A8H7CPD9_9AGAR|nr:HET-domain-containing protein [Mycena sanguinolenta]
MHTGRSGGSGGQRTGRPAPPRPSGLRPIARTRALDFPQPGMQDAGITQEPMLGVPPKMLTALPFEAQLIHGLEQNIDSSSIMITPRRMGGKNREGHSASGRPRSTANSISLPETQATVEKLEKWLQAPTDMTQKQKEMETLHIEGTGKWFLDGDAFAEWEEEAGVLWIQGPPGSGKSVLSSTVIKHLLEQEKPFTAVTFFYFDFQKKETQNIETALCQLILQLSAQSPHLYRTLDHHYRLSNGQKLPSYKDLRHIHTELLREFAQIYIVVDALDECNKNNYSQVVNFVLALHAWTETSVHLLITSQAQDLFTKSFRGLTSITLNVEVTKDDMEIFVANKLNTNPDLEIWEHHPEPIHSKIIHKSNGMFRLAACYLTELASCKKEDQLDETLKNLPDNMLEFYFHALIHIQQNDWVYVEALLPSITFSQDQQYWDQVSPDFLALGLWNTCDHGYLNIACVLQKKVQDQNYSSLLEIAAHLGNLKIASVLLDIDTNARDYAGALGAAAYKGNLNIVLFLLERGTNINVGTKKYGSALAAAAYQGNMEIVSLLLDKGAYINDKPNGTSLYQSSLAIVSLFLEEEVYVNAGSGEYGTALGAAAYQNNLAIVSFLLEKGADVNARGGKYGSALGAAAYQGNIGIVSLLLNKGANINSEAGQYGTAIGAAAYRGNFDIVSLLYLKGARINKGNRQYDSVLGSAAYGGSLQTVSLLLEKGAYVNDRRGPYGSPLGAAAYQGNLEIVSLLLAKGASIDAECGEYGSILEAAAHQGNKDIVSFLLEKGANINDERGQYGSALGAAAYQGHQQIVSILLEKGASIDRECGEYGSALGVAAFRGHLEIVSFLLEKGANVNVPSKKYDSILAAAACQGNLEIVCLLLDHDADIKSQGCRAIKEATDANHNDIVHLLQMKSTAPDTKQKYDCQH